MSVTTGLGEERVVALPQGPIRVYERGPSDGDPVVFVHGLFANAAAWRRVVPLLADRHRCITADWPFGAHQLPMASGADLTPAGIAATIAETLAALELGEVTLVGNDGGGMLAQLVVANHPERIGRLVLTPCDAYENFPPRMFDPLCWVARAPGGIAGLSRLMRLGVVRRAPFAYGWLSHKRVPDEVLDHYLAGLGDPGVRRDAAKFLRSVSNRYTLDAARSFGDFDRPVLIAWATDDRFFPLADAERFAADFPDARLELISGSRTYVGEDQPERLAALIGEFIETTTKEASHAAS